MDQHVKPNLLCLYEYSGRNKKIRAADFAEYDVVTASYHEVVSQVSIP